MQTKQDKAQSTPARVSYVTPKLVKYGKLASLVQGGTIPSSTEDLGYFSVPV